MPSYLVFCETVLCIHTHISGERSEFKINPTKINVICEWVGLKEGLGGVGVGEVCFESVLNRGWGRGEKGLEKSNL